MLRRRIIFKKPSVEIPFSQASVGDILCSDNTVVSAANYTGSGKTAIGIVFHNSSGNMRCMALSTVTQKYGGYGQLLGIEKTTYEDASADLDGAYNSLYMRTWISGDTIAFNCYMFSTAGTSAGDWYCPAAGEVKILGQNLSTINASRSALGLSSIGAFNVFVTSTEYDSEYCWYGYSEVPFRIDYNLGKDLSNYPTYPVIKKTY